MRLYRYAFTTRQERRATGAWWRRTLEGEYLPPVALIRSGDIYYVRDGHHRISVARAFGQMMVEAAVTVWKIG